MITLNPIYWHTICQNVTNTVSPIFHIPFPVRVKSSILSSVFEIEAAKYYQSKGYKVKNAETDREPDLIFEETNTPIEIKVTKNSKEIKFRGNKVSKRESQFIMIIWDESGNTLKFYVTTLYLTPKDWSKDCANYNASFLKYENIKDKCIDLVGNRMILNEYQG